MNDPARQHTPRTLAPSLLLVRPPASALLSALSQGCQGREAYATKSLVMPWPRVNRDSANGRLPVSDLQLLSVSPCSTISLSLFPSLLLSISPCHLSVSPYFSYHSFITSLNRQHISSSLCLVLSRFITAPPLL